MRNAAAALWVAGAVDDLGAGVARAAESLDSGAASRVLDEVRRAAPAEADQDGAPA